MDTDRLEWKDILSIKGWQKIYIKIFVLGFACVCIIRYTAWEIFKNINIKRHTSPIIDDANDVLKDI